MEGFTQKWIKGRYHLFQGGRYFGPMILLDHWQLPPKPIWIEIMVIEAFNCMIRRADSYDRLPYYYIDQPARFLETIGVHFSYITDWNTLPEAPQGPIPQVILLGTPCIPVPTEFFHKLKRWSEAGGAMIILGREKMFHPILNPINAFLSPWQIALNSDLLNPDQITMTILDKIIGFPSTRRMELLHDTGCSIKTTALSNIQLSVGLNDQVGLVGIEIEKQGRMVVWGTYWPWTNHGSSGFTCADNHSILIMILHWLARKTLKLPPNLCLNI